MKTHVKKGDEVEIIAGRNHKGKRGTVLAVNASKGTVIVEGARTLKKAVRPTEQNPPGKRELHHKSLFPSLCTVPPGLGT